MRRTILQELNMNGTTTTDLMHQQNVFLFISFFLIVIISVVKHVFACFDASLQFVCSRVYAKMLFNCLC